MSDGQFKLTAEQVAQLKQGAERLAALEEFFHQAQLALQAAAKCFQMGCDIPEPEPQSEPVQLTPKYVVRDAQGNFAAADSTGRFIFRSPEDQAVYAGPFTVWTLADDGQEIVDISTLNGDESPL